MDDILIALVIGACEVLVILSVYYRGEGRLEGRLTVGKLIMRLALLSFDIFWRVCSVLYTGVKMVAEIPLEGKKVK